MTFAAAERHFLSPPDPHDCPLDGCGGIECEDAARDLAETDAIDRADADRKEAGW